MKLSGAVSALNCKHQDTSSHPMVGTLTGVNLVQVYIILTDN